MIREINTHKVNPLNDKLAVEVLDEPGAGGACHRYAITLPDGTFYNVRFQNGPINEAGVNGLTHEALLAILIDRLQCFQKGPYACRENALALTKLDEALLWLCKRTLDRIQRGVEGTSEK